MWPRAERVIVLGSGPSLHQISAAQVAAANAVIIAVNGAIEWTERADYWFTLDPSGINLVRANNPRRGTHYVMAVPKVTPTPQHVTRIDRIIGTLFDRARAPGGLSERHNGVNTGNSAFGALGLAYHMRPSKIVLLGVDATQERRIDGGMPRTLAHLPPLFETAVPQLDQSGIDVVNGSPNSAITCFPRMTPQEALTWLQQ